jgi:hypothetical protein
MTVETSRLYPSRTLVIPDASYTNLYAIFYDLNTGDMFNATTGVVETTWANAAVAAAVHANNKGVWLITTPTIVVEINVGMNLYQNASPANTDSVVKGVKFDPRRIVTYTDATPAAQGKTFTR